MSFILKKHVFIQVPLNRIYKNSNWKRFRWDVKNMKEKLEDNRAELVCYTK